MLVQSLIEETMILHPELCSQKRKKKKQHYKGFLSRGSITILISQMERNEGWENQGICPGSQDKKDRAWLQCPVGDLEVLVLPSRRGSHAGVWRGDRFPFFSSLSPPGGMEAYSKHTRDAVHERIGSIGMLGSICRLTGRFRIFWDATPWV